MECIVGTYRRSQERKEWILEVPESLMEISLVDCSEVDGEVGREVDKGCRLCLTDGISDFEEKVLYSVIARNFLSSLVIAIVDCFEIFVERPLNLYARAQTWSSY